MAIDSNVALPIREIIPMLRHCIRAKRPAFLWSGPGIGKSSIISALAKELGGICIDMRLSQMEPTDVRGIPFLGADKNGKQTMTWAPPDLFPTKEMAAEHKIIILFLDELNSAAPAVQAAAYQLVLDRRVGAYELPDNVMILAAGNREQDRGVTYRMASPLANRLLHFEIKVDFDDWLDWALTENIHPDVVSFLSTNKAKLYDFVPTSADKSFPTPRSWEFVSQLISVGPKDKKLTDGEIRTMVTAAVGGGTASDFMAYLKIGKNLPAAADILSGKVTELNTHEISAQYQIIMNMLYELRDYWFTNSNGTGVMEKIGDRQVEKREWHDDKDYLKTWASMLDNFNAFALEKVNQEVGIMGVRSAFRNYNFMRSMQMTKLKTWNKIAEKWGKYIINV